MSSHVADYIWPFAVRSELETEPVEGEHAQENSYAKGE